MKKKKDSSVSELAAVRVPKPLRDEARRFTADNDLTFSQLMRRALRRELGLPIPKEEQPSKP